MADGGEPGVDSRDEGKHTGKTDLLFVKTKLWSWRGYSGPMCNKQKNSTMTRSSRFHYPIGVIKTDHGRVVDITCIPTTCCGEIFF